MFHVKHFRHQFAVKYFTAEILMKDFTVDNQTARVLRTRAHYHTQMRTGVGSF